jgi:hypothetical protein
VNPSRFEESTKPLPCSKWTSIQTFPGPSTLLLQTATDLTMTYSENQIRSSELMVAERIHHSQSLIHPPQITEPKDL